MEAEITRSHLRVSVTCSQPQLLACACGLGRAQVVQTEHPRRDRLFAAGCERLITCFLDLLQAAVNGQIDSGTFEEWWRAEMHPHFEGDDHDSPRQIGTREYGTYTTVTYRTVTHKTVTQKTVKARLWPWLSGQSPRARKCWGPRACSRSGGAPRCTPTSRATTTTPRARLVRASEASTLASTLAPKVNAKHRKSGPKTSKIEPLYPANDAMHCFVGSAVEKIWHE